MFAQVSFVSLLLTSSLTPSSCPSFVFKESEILSGVRLDDLLDPAKELDASAWSCCSCSQPFQGELDMLVYSQRTETFLLAFCYSHSVVALRRRRVANTLELVVEREYTDFPFVTFPVGIALDFHRGLVFVSGGQECHGVAVFNEDNGQVVGRLDYKFNLPACLAMDRRGTLIICNRRANNIQVWTYQSQVRKLTEYCWQVVHDHQLVSL